MQANGDDFVIVDLRGKADMISPDIARRLGDRNRGIGFNQLAAVLDCADASALLEFWNPDGSRLDTCGSATRGVADMLMRESATDSVTVRTRRGLLGCRRISDTIVSVDMGKPLLDWRDIPLAREADTLALPLAGDPTACNMGNPHCTFFVDDIAAVDVAALGPVVESDPLFPRKTNVHFVQVIDRGRIRLRIWERGGGIPLGSGSCSCGAAVGGMRRELLDRRVEVECDGGTVSVEWDGINGVQLAGPVAPVFEGVLADHLLRNTGQR
jgi:diaminopimelate epimerase